MSKDTFMETGVRVIRSGAEAYMERSIRAENRHNYAITQLQLAVSLLADSKEEFTKAHELFRQARDTLNKSNQECLEPAIQLGQQLGLELMSNPAGPVLAAALGEIATETIEFSTFFDRHASAAKSGSPEAKALHAIGETRDQIESLFVTADIEALRHQTWATLNDIEGAIEATGFLYE